MTTIKIKPKNQEKKKVIIDNQIEDDDNLIKVDQEDIKWLIIKFFITN